MAIDDVVSVFDTDVADNGRVFIVPASGDEWLVTHIGVEATGAWKMTSHTNTDEWSAGTITSQTSLTNDIAQTGFFRPYQLFLSGVLGSDPEFESIRLLNSAGDTYSFGFSAIKTKD
jgi:hypothetical protein